MKPLITSPLGVHHSLSGDERSANPTTIRVQRERPILMSGPMVLALQENRKTQTRRIVKAGYFHSDIYHIAEMGEIDGCAAVHFSDSAHAGLDVRCPYGAPGDKLWCRETWAPRGVSQIGGGPLETLIAYRADGAMHGLPHHDIARVVGEWKPSIFMPRWASRITLEITNIRVERLQDISEVDAKAEGAPEPTGRRGCYPAPWATAKAGPIDYRDSYRALWERINGRGSWAKNPWVWVIAFRKVTP